jgi:hypothetical protein
VLIVVVVVVVVVVLVCVVGWCFERKKIDEGFQWHWRGWLVAKQPAGLDVWHRACMWRAQAFSIFYESFFIGLSW